MVASALDKAEKEESRLCSKLRLRIDMVEGSLREDTSRPITQRTVNSLIQSLEQALVLYEDSVAVVCSAAPEEEVRKEALSDKLFQQTTTVTSLLDRLQEKLV